jgi:hypothetical protein
MKGDCGEANQISRRIDAFLTAREGNILSKLLAISADFIPQETFEIQVKVRLPELIDVNTLLAEAGIFVTRSSIRDQYDTYFLFGDNEWTVISAKTRSKTSGVNEGNFLHDDFDGTKQRK